jgi:hydroxyacylglutathione hydrolase
MFFQRIFTPGLAINTYLIGDLAAKTCAIIDPPRCYLACLAMAQSADLTITDIIETHVHADFVSGALELKNVLNNKPKIHCSQMGGSSWVPQYADHQVQDGEIIKQGSVKIQAIHTPGHSPEHLIYICFDEKRSSDTPWLACTGDLLFVGGVGRPDLLGKESFNLLAGQLYQSLFKILASFPDFLEIYPCHAAGSLCGKFDGGRWSSTLGYERLFNSYLREKREKDWIESIRKDFKDYPDQFQRIKSLNLQGPPLLESLTIMVAEGSCQDLELEAFFILDVRMPIKFAAGHLKGSINIPFQDSFCQWCSWLIPSWMPLGLVVDDHHCDAQIANQLRLIGFDQPIMVFTLNARNKFSFPMEIMEMLTPAEAKQGQSCGMYFLDVRSQLEWSDQHIEGARNIELSQLEKYVGLLPPDLTIVTICKSGMRASIASSILKKKGFDTATIQGGMQAWSAAGLPHVSEKN